MLTVAVFITSIQVKIERGASAGVQGSLLVVVDMSLEVRVSVSRETKGGEGEQRWLKITCLR